MPSATPAQQLWFGVLMLCVAAWLGYTVWSGMPGWSVPPLIACLVAACFGTVGVSLFLQRAGYPRAGGFMIFLFALGMAASTGSANLDVLIHSTFGAKFYGGSDAVDQYKEDPEASVFERFEIRVNAVGRVP